MKKKKKGRILIRLGLLMIMGALALTAYNMYESYQAELIARESVNYLSAIIAPEVKPTQWIILGTSVPTQTPVPAVTDRADLTDAPVPSETPMPTETPAPTQMPVPTEESATDYYIPSDGFFVIPPAGQVGQTTVRPTETPPAINVDGAGTLIETEIPDYILNPNMEMPINRFDGQDYIGILEIPALDLTIPVISEWSYPRLKIAPCRYYGSAYTNNMVIAAHNYASHFGGLKDLYTGALVIFTDMDGNRFTYRVGMKETLDPRDVQDMIDSGWDLSLFTCTVGGSYRVTIRCALVGGAGASHAK